MKRVLFFLVLASLVVGLLLPTLPAFAEKPPKEQVYTEALGRGETRVNDHTVVKKVRDVPGTNNIEYTAEISSLPETLSDLKTLIVCEWRQGSDLDGGLFYENGSNLYYARVTGTYVSVEYDSKSAAWDPTLRLNGEELSLLSGPTLVKDPLNSNYSYNTIQWLYKLKSVKITRYLRQIEGSLQEYYILDKDPGATLEISNGYKQEKGFDWMGDIYAFDSKGVQLQISGDSTIKLVSKEEFARRGLKYPVTIDPTTSITTASYDAGLYTYNTVYATARTSTSGTVGSGSYYADIGQIFFNPNYYISRYATYFDTSAVPLTCTLISGSIQLSGYSDASDTDFSIVVQSGMPTYPSVPPISTNYNQALYTGSGGSLTTLYGWSVSGYNIIPLDATGLSWINKGGWTKFLLRSDRDINNYTPTYQELVGAFTYEFGVGFQPKLVLSYTVPPSTPVISSLSSGGITSTQALLLGQLTSDGGVPCSVRFEYGTTTAYGTPTAWQSGYSSGQTFAAYTDALLPGTLYHWTARASNSGGTSSANDATLLTLPEAPTVFTVTPGNIKNDLAWVKGTGSGNTYIYRRTDHSPTLRSEAGNVLVYSGAAAAYADTPLTNSITYYYSAWAEKTTSGLQQFSSTYMSGSGTPYTTGVATVTTQPATGYDTAPGTSATFHGFLVSLNGYASANCYFQYYWGAGTWTDHSTIADLDTLTAPGSFDVTLGVGSLPAATLIHMRAVGDNGDVGGPGYGSDISFTTGSASAPTVTSNPATGVTKTTANVMGTITSTGGVSVVTVWFKYGTTTAYGLQTTPITLSPVANGQTFSDVLGLNPYPALEVNTTYHFVAVAQNSVGTTESSDRTFVTLAPVVPVVVTLAAINVGATGADLQGTLSEDGGVPCQVEFEYGPTAAYEFGETGWQGSYTSGQSFSVHLTGIAVGNTTHFRAKAKNAGGAHNGSDSSFTTVFTAPTNFMAKALDSSTLSVTWKKVGDQTLVVIKKGSSPAGKLDGDTYQGADEAYSFTGREDGVTYFLKAWSWKSDGTYSTDYVEDASTTPGAGTAPTGAAASALTKPEAPGWWFGTPSGTRMVHWPGYSAVESGASGWGIPSSTAWLIYWAMLLTALVGAAGIMTSSGMVMLLVLVLGLFAMAAIIGALGWLIIVMAIVGITVLLITSR